ncbi:hypothetical protein TNCV_799531 [Trichonephila clavipes]|nr:hypothetical protein TNCV_799531 [Trichonephila clavipes]
MTPQSYDLNPTEHQCDLLERRIRQHNVSSKDMLKSVLKDQWEKKSAEKTPRSEISPIPTQKTICGNRGGRAIKRMVHELTSAEGLASTKKRVSYQWMS